MPLHSFWTSGSRVGCSGQIAWCFNRTSASAWKLDAFLNSAGDCLLISRAKNSTGGVVYEPLLEDCNVRVSLACMSKGNPNVGTNMEGNLKNTVFMKTDRTEYILFIIFYFSWAGTIARRPFAQTSQHARKMCVLNF